MDYTIIFYGSMFLSIFFLTISLIRNSWMYMLFSVVFAIPFSLYLSFMPMLRWVIIVPVIYFLIFYLFHIKVHN